MVFSGMAMLFLGVYGWVLSKRDQLARKRWFTKLMVGAISLPFIANSTGWIMTEIGRQPWVVFGVMKTEDAVSPLVTAKEVLFSLIAFSALYAILAGVCAYLFIRVIRNEETGVKVAEQHSTDPFDREEDAYAVSQ